MAFENYQTWSWAIYALSALLVMLVTFRITRNWNTGVKAFLRVTILVLMAVPWYVDGTQGVMAPAFTISVFEGLTSGGNQWMRAGLPLLSVLVISYFVLVIGLWISRKKETDSTESDEEKKDNISPQSAAEKKQRMEPGL